METTLGEYSGSKLKQDTISKNTRGWTKFETHTKFVLKIKAIGQIIVADYFSANISDAFNEIKTKCDYLVTLIDKKMINYLILKYSRDKNNEKIIKILKCGRIIDKKLIDSFFKD
jgi:hypothetical protein